MTTPTNKTETLAERFERRSSSDLDQIRVLRDAAPAVIDTVTMAADEARALRELAKASVAWKADARSVMHLIHKIEAYAALMQRKGKQ